MMNTRTLYYSPQLIKKIFASGAIGNILETYDLILISLTATTLSKVFFSPAAGAYTHLIDVFYIFLIGFLVRPIGNIIMGTYADQIGRKKLMVISLVFTGLGTAFIGLIPSYSYMGIGSAILFVSLRIFQNFFAGIEYINSATYLIESSEKNTRGFYGSWTAIGTCGGYLLASVVVLLVSYFIAKGILPAWSWRFIFLFSLVGLALGFWIRCAIPESLTFMINNPNTQPAKKWDIVKGSLKFIKNNPALCLSICALTMMGSCLSFIYYVDIPIFLTTTRNFSPDKALSINIFSLSLIVILIPIFGKLSDFFSKIKLLKIVCFTVLFLGMPFFWFASYGSYGKILPAALLISVPSACFFALYPVIITESFPAKIRCTTASLIYQIIISLQMGTMPLLATYIVKITHIPYAPGYLLIAATILGFCGLIFLKKIEDEKK